MRAASPLARANQRLTDRACLPRFSQVVFKVKKTTKFEKILNAFCQKKAVDISQVRFVFDGTRINPSMTPEDMDMEDGDTVRCLFGPGARRSCAGTHPLLADDPAPLFPQVDAFLEQTGGH